MGSIIFLAAVIIVILWAIGAYNGLVTLKNQVENAWRQIDVQLKRRHDLIPNLVNTVKGAMEFERETLERVMEARSKALSASSVRDKGLAENMLTDALGKLFALVENYPDLKSNQNVMALQEELTSTENRVSFARQFYNDLVAKFNTKQEVFPNMIIASILGFSKADYFQAEQAAKAVPEVDLSLK
ncbi:MAG TPA: LemA family protein [Deltaproteobacteria bacterium]|nr:LemA family protein [Deltaproteobacteria bacterium]